MIWIDYAILAIVGISGVISLMRGFIREALSLASWIAAFWIAFAFCGEASVWFDGYIEGPSERVGVAFVAIFFGVLLLCAGIIRLVGGLVEGTGLSGVDRTLGTVFGMLRGVVIAAVLVLLAGLTPLPRYSWWDQSLLMPHFVDLGNELRALLPPDMQQGLRFDPDSWSDEVEIDSLPELETDALPELEAGSLPELETDSLPELETDSLS